jgi:hypothetical protein
MTVANISGPLSMVKVLDFKAKNMGLGSKSTQESVFTADSGSTTSNMVRESSPIKKEANYFKSGKKVS